MNMKKIISLVLAVLMLGILCLPAYAASDYVDRILDETEDKMGSYVHRFEMNCLSLPVTISSVIFANIKVEIDGEDVYFDSALDLDKTTFDLEDTFLVFPKEEEYVEPIISALTKNLPFLLVEKKSAETNGTLITVSLPGMTKELRNVCESLLSAYAENTDAYIHYLRSTTADKLIAAGGSDADKAAFDKICDDAVSKMNAIKDKCAECIHTRREMYLEEHPEDADEDDAKIGTVLSEGNLIVIVAVAAAVVFGLGGFFLGRKKKTVLAGGAEKEFDEK
ncbi:MAG: hypothetical protein MJ078_00180 [Clostridia bacterium]|nr:hypothetical protein [Clostridia bacterium]